LLHPPIGFVPGERALTTRPDDTGASKGIDYRW
jgi:hypothetical protein